jgi:O-antigen ligase
MMDTLRRILLFIVGLTMPAEILAVVQGLVTVNKLATALLLLFALVMMGTRGVRFPHTPKNPLMLVVMLSLTVSLLFSWAAGIPGSLIFTITQVYVALTIYYFLLVYVLTDLRDVEILILGTVVGGAIVSASVLLRITQTATEALIGMRTGGIGGNPNGFAVKIMIPLMGAVYFATAYRSLVIRAASAAVVAIILLSLLQSLSRGGYVALTAMGLFYMFRFLRLRSIGLVLPAVFMVGVLWIGVSEDVVARIGTMFGSQRELDRSIQGRLQQYERASSTFASNPLIGIGVARSRVPEAWGGGIEGGAFVQTVHNTYLTIAAEQGLLGLLPFLGILFLSWRDYSRAWRLRGYPGAEEDPDLQRLSLMGAMLQVAFAGILVGGSFVAADRFKVVWMMFGVSTAVLALANRRYAEVEGPSDASLVDESGSWAGVLPPPASR